MKIDPEIAKLLADLNEVRPSIRREFDELFAKDSDAVPVPFFGDLTNAHVITVGLNPSDGEFRGRGWPNPVDTTTLCERLPNYFAWRGTPPHPWFSPWAESLQEVGVSYANQTAAHVDLCPWPTRPMRAISNKPRFEVLVAQSLPWF